MITMTHKNRKLCVYLALILTVAFILSAASCSSSTSNSNGNTNLKGDSLNSLEESSNNSSTETDDNTPSKPEEFYATEDGTKRVLSTSNITELSSNKNLIIFLVDRLDSRYVDNALSNTPEVFDSLTGFTYFDDHISLYGRTFPSVTYMLTGVENDFSQKREDYFRSAYQNSEFLNVLKQNNYKIKIYTDSYYAYTDASIMGRYASNLSENETDKFTTDQKFVYDLVNNSEFYLDNENNNFSFIHIQGCHMPNVYDESFNDMGEDHPDRWNELVAINTSMQIINVYIEELKARGLYNDSTIIIVGDHAAAISDKKELSGVRRTALLVKPAGQSRGNIKINSSYVSHENLWATALKSEGLAYEYDFANSVFEANTNRQTIRKYVFQRMDSGFFENITYSICGSSKDFDNWTIVDRENIEGSVHK